MTTYSRETEAGRIVRYLPALFEADKKNNIGDDLSSYLINGSVECDLDRIEGSKMVFQARVKSGLDLPPMRSYVAPFLRLISEDGEEVLEQLGLYVLVPSKAEHYPRQTFNTLDGRDLGWLLAANQTPVTVTDSIGSSPVQLSHTALNSVGIKRHNIQTSSYVNPKSVTFPIGTSRLQRINARMQSLGYYDLWFDREGRPTSRAYDDLDTVQPAVRYTSEAGSRIVPPVLDEPDNSRLCNRVIVVGTDAALAPIVAVAFNNDPLSPMAFQNNDNNWITRYIESPDIKTQAAADAMAKQLLQEGASFYRKITIQTLPDPTRNPREVYELDIHNPSGEVATGKWRCTGWKMALDWKQPVMTHSLNRVEKFEATFV